MLKAMGEEITPLLDGKGQSAEEMPVLQRPWQSHKNGHTDRQILGVCVLHVHEINTATVRCTNGQRLNKGKAELLRLKDSGQLELRA